MAPALLQTEIARGARFVAYPWCASLVFVTIKRVSRTYYLKPGETGFGTNFRWSLLSLLAGWWSFHGVIWTLKCLMRNLRGGTDMTDAFNADMVKFTGIPVLPAGSYRPSPPALHPAPLAAFGCAFLLAVALGAAFDFAEREKMPVALVNGLDQAYSATVNGRVYELAAHSVKRLVEPEGSFAISALLPGAVSETRFAFEVSRSGTLKAAVINPDATALVVEHAVESTAPSEGTHARLGSRQFYAGRQWLVLDRPRDFLPNPPASGFRTMTASTRVEVLADLPLTRRAELIARELDRPSLLGYLQTLCALYPQNEDLLGLATSMLTAAEGRGFFAQRLEQRPALGAWHRHWLSFAAKNLPAENLSVVYSRLAEGEPDEGLFAFLNAQLLTESDQAQQWYERALAAKRPCSDALAGLASILCARSDYSGALAVLDRASQGGASEESSRLLRIDCLLALKQFPEARRIAEARLRARPNDLAALDDVIAYTFLSLGAQEASLAVKERFNGLAVDLREREGAAIRIHLHGVYSYLKGDFPTFLEALRIEETVPLRLSAELTKGDFGAAEQLLAKANDAPSSFRLLLYLAAFRASDFRVADYWEQAVAAMERETGYDRRIAAHLRGATPMTTQELLDVPVPNREKCVLLAALGSRDPDNRAAFFTRAAECNAHPLFPYHLVAAVVATAKP